MSELRSFNRIRLLALTTIMAASSAQASIIVDNFTTASTTITQTGSGTTTSASVTGSGILGSRTISIAVLSPLTSGSAGVSSGMAIASFAGTYSSVNLADNFTLSESFASVNAVGDGLTELDLDLASASGTSVTITANGTSTYTFNVPSNISPVEETIDFSAFSNPSVFSSLTSLTFQEVFPNSGTLPSVQFADSISLTPVIVPPPAVPEPSTMILCMASLASIGGTLYFRRK